MSSKLQAPNKQEMSLSIPAYTHNPIFILKNCFGHSPYIRPSNALGAGIVAKWHPTLCDAVNCSTPGSPVLHCLLEFAQIHVHWVSAGKKKKKKYLLEFAQTHVHWVGDAIQPSHSLWLFSFCLQSFLVSGAFPVSWLFTSGGQSTGASASASILPMSIQGWFPLHSLVWSPCCIRDSQSLLQHHSSKASILRCSAFLMVHLSHQYMTTGKITALTIRTFVGKVKSSLFNMLSRFIIAFLSRSKSLLISWLQSLSPVISMGHV